MRPTALVVGASLAGARTAQALQREGWDGRIVVVGEEAELAYDRPPLSKAFLAGRATAGEIALAPNGLGDAVELYLGRRAEMLDPVGHRVLLDGGEELAYDALVVATGARPRPAPWVVPSGLHLLRTLADATALRADLESGGPVVVIGAGFIGTEVAATVRSRGLDVTLADPAPAPLQRVVGPEVGGLVAAKHIAEGVDVRLDVPVESVSGERGDLEVRLGDGVVLPAATVVVGIGALPNTGWLEGSGLTVDDGLVCDATCRAVGVDDVWAVGDVARWWHPRHGQAVRVEHWTNAVEAARTVARNIVGPGRPVEYAPVEYVWSDQYDWTIQIVGRPAGAARAEVVGDVSEGRLAAVYGDPADRLCGLAAVNSPRAMIEVRRRLAAAEPTSFDDAVDRVRALTGGRRVVTS